MRQPQASSGRVSVVRTYAIMKRRSIEVPRIWIRICDLPRAPDMLQRQASARGGSHHWACASPAELPARACCSLHVSYTVCGTSGGGDCVAQPRTRHDCLPFKRRRSKSPRCCLWAGGGGAEGQEQPGRKWRCPAPGEWPFTVRYLLLRLPSAEVGKRQRSQDGCVKSGTRSGALVDTHVL